MKGFCVWFTGLPASGKSTLATLLARELERRGYRAQVLDGDQLRTRLSRGLGFSKEDRDAHIDRIAFVANCIVRAGGVAISCAISPYRAARDAARAEIGNFVEVYVSTPLEVCMRRDPKGLYQKAIEGKIPNFTGVSDPYEPPQRPEVTVPAHLHGPEECVRRILQRLSDLGYVVGGPIRPHGGILVDRVARGEFRESLVEEAGRLPSLEIDDETADDVRNVATGVFSPLTGFLGKEDVESVVERRRLASGVPWTIPIVLDATPAEADGAGSRAVLKHRGKALAVLSVESRFTPDVPRLCQRVFGTTDAAHPGVARFRALKPVFLGGPLWLLEDPQETGLRLSPRQTRAIFEKRGFRTVAAFQTRNIPHLAHEHLHRLALNFCDGLFLHPVIGRKKPGDFRDEVILAAYRVLIESFYPRERTVLATLHTWMRYAGPAEAIHHAILRKNFGCTHILIGRDHAGVGKYYEPFAAHRIFDEFPDLEIRPLKVAESFYCSRCKVLATSNDCPHPEEQRETVSASQIRAALAGGNLRLPHRVRDEILAVIRSFPEPLVP